MIGTGTPRELDAVPAIAVIVDDLAFFEGEAIARPVTAMLGATTPLLRRLELAAGEALAGQLRIGEPLAVGSAVVTGAGALGVDLLVHAVISSDSEQVTAGSVRRATLSALQRAADWRIARLAFAPFGLGAGNLDPDESATAMASAIGEHVARAAMPKEITIVVENEDERRAFAARLDRPA